MDNQNHETTLTEHDYLLFDIIQNLDKYAFDEKFSILESKLSKLLELEREQIKRG